MEINYFVAVREKCDYIGPLARIEPALRCSAGTNSATACVHAVCSRRSIQFPPFLRREDCSRSYVEFLPERGL